MKRVSKALFLCGCILFLIPALASGDDFLPPEPFYVVSEDRSKVFHVVPKWQEWYAWNEDDFPATGLYYNAEPLVPIYLVEDPFVGSVFGYLWEYDFNFSRDMQYFVWAPATNATACDIAEITALVFYARGRVQKAYMVSDLVHDADAVFQTVTMTKWRQNRSGAITFDAETNHLTVRTIDEQIYVFDITSGEIIEINGKAVGAIHPQARFFTSQSVALIAAGVILLIGALIFLQAKRKRANQEI